MIYSTEEAAKYLGVSVSLVKYYKHVDGRLSGQKIGNSLVFTQQELDDLNETRKKVGRPSTQIDRVNEALRLSEINGELIIKRGRFVHIVQRLSAGKKNIINLDFAPSRMSMAAMVANIKREGD